MTMLIGVFREFGEFSLSKSSWDIVMYWTARYREDEDDGVAMVEDAEDLTTRRGHPFKVQRFITVVPD